MVFGQFTDLLLYILYVALAFHPREFLQNFTLHSLFKYYTINIQNKFSDLTFERFMASFKRFIETRGHLVDKIIIFIEFSAACHLLFKEVCLFPTLFSPLCKIINCYHL